MGDVAKKNYFNRSFAKMERCKERCSKQHGQRMSAFSKWYAQRKDAQKKYRKTDSYKQKQKYKRARKAAEKRARKEGSMVSI